MTDLTWLDFLTIVSVLLQVQNQNDIVGIRDVQKEVDRAIDTINTHLAEQDTKLSKILEVLYEIDREIV